MLISDGIIATEMSIVNAVFGKALMSGIIKKLSLKQTGRDLYRDTPDHHRKIRHVRKLAFSENYMKQSDIWL